MRLRKLIDFICPECKNIFQDNPSQKRKYCSRNCKERNSSRPKTFIDCMECGLNYHPENGNLKQKTCSPQCSMTRRAKLGLTKKGRKYPHLQRARVGNCDTCGDEYRAVKDFSDKKQRYCSHKCYMHSRKETTPERIVRETLEAIGIKFNQEHKIGRYYADFFIPEQNLVIEVDGTYWHSLPSVIKRDEAKDEYYKAMGYKVVRVAESKVKDFRKRYAKFVNNNELPDNWEELTPAIKSGELQAV